MICTPHACFNLRVYLRYTVSTSHARPATKRSYSSLPIELDIIEVLSSWPWATYSRATLCVSRLKQITIKALQIASCRLQDSNLQRSWETNAKNAGGGLGRGVGFFFSRHRPLPHITRVLFSLKVCFRDVPAIWELGTNRLTKKPPPTSSKNDHNNNKIL